jgi:hypothetical protein
LQISTGYLLGIFLFYGLLFWIFRYLVNQDCSPIKKLISAILVLQFCRNIMPHSLGNLTMVTMIISASMFLLFISFIFTNYVRQRCQLH